MPPKNTIIKMGDKRSIFASGARVIDRKPARATADASSDSPGITLSSRVGGCWLIGMAGTAGTAGAAARLVFAVYWPV